MITSYLNRLNMAPNEHILARFKWQFLNILNDH